MTHPQNLDLPLDLGHPERRIDASPTDKLDGHLLSPLTVQTQLDLSKLALAECLQEQVRAKFGDRAAWVGGRVSYGSRVRVDIAVCWASSMGSIVGLGLLCGRDDLVGSSLLAARLGLGLGLRVGLGLELVELGRGLDRDRDGPRDSRRQPSLESANWSSDWCGSGGGRRRRQWFPVGGDLGMRGVVRDIGGGGSRRRRGGC